MPIDIRSFAREGARQRIQELQTEIAAIRRAFPELAGRGPSPARVEKSKSEATPKKRGRRTPMTPAERKAVGLRMKAYWAARRKSASGG